MAVAELRLGDTLALPLDAVTETIGWLGNKGSGKTYGAKVMAEEMLRVGAQVVVLDPVDSWYGLRYGANRQSSGLPIYVFGREGSPRVDAPLEATAGALLADVVVERGISAVFSLRHLSKGDQRRFCRDFCARLYLRKGEDEYRTAIHVFIEEAHTFAPQTLISSDKDMAGCLGAVQDLVLEGRSSGIGVSLVTQRVASVAKSVLELCEVLAAFRTTGPLARKRLKEWFDAQDGEDHLAEFLGAIQKLPQGTCWLWSPGWLNLFERTKIRRSITFDSSATPKAGEARPLPTGKAADLDLAALGEQIRETRERAEANDPRKLKARIADLECDLANARADVTIETKEVPVPYVPDELRLAVENAVSAAARLANEGRIALGQHIDAVLFAANVAHSAMDDIADAAIIPPPTAPIPPQPAAAAPHRERSTPRRDPDTGLSDGQAKILAALAEAGGTSTALHVARRIVMSRNGGGFRTAVKNLVTAGMITSGPTMTLTELGEAEASAQYDAGVLPQDLLEAWCAHPKMNDSAQRALRWLTQRYPQEYAPRQLAEGLGMQVNGGGFRMILKRCKSFEIVEGSQHVRVCDEIGARR